jgi:hypothetical protein
VFIPGVYWDEQTLARLAKNGLSLGSVVNSQGSMAPNGDFPPWIIIIIHRQLIPSPKGG